MSTKTQSIGRRAFRWWRENRLHVAEVLTMLLMAAVFGFAFCIVKA